MADPADDDRIWWEVWLRRHDGKELERLMEFGVRLRSSARGPDVGERRLPFDNRIVVLVGATPAELSTSVDDLNDLAKERGHP